ncbi:MAG TPA: S41 family peptidase [Sphingobacteriaceae bacterium]|nr:S41 family peptidase [Sphingobacteriaceae bacterium]
MKKKLFNGLIVFLILSTSLFSCKKESPTRPIEKPERTLTTEDLLKDSVYMYTDYFYLWQDQLPPFGSLKPENYKTAEQVLEALKSYAKDLNGQPLDRFSFLDRTGAVNESIQEGLSGSFGFDVRYNNETDLFIKLVYPNSPADKAGINRGWQILEINGNKDLDLAAFDADNFAFLNRALSAPSINLKLKREDGVETNKQLLRTNFQIKPILYDHIYTVGAKKVGYFVFESFVSTEGDGGTDTYVKNDLNQLFARFENEGVSEVIVDLRYNGGGAVITAEYMSNMLVPVSANDKLMYSYEINKEMEADGWKDIPDFFTPVNFEKTNALNLNRIYFLVTAGSTASASELLINNLNPFIETKLIGEARTYGKPVGYFPWEILNVDLYAVSFKTTNNVGYGDYFNGMPVDINVGDDVSKDWGNIEEGMLKQALYYAQNGTFLQGSTLQAGRKAAVSVNDSRRLNMKLDQKGNHDMFKLKKVKLPVGVRSY